MQDDKKHIVIVGGGFAGLAAAKVLARKNVDLTIVDRLNHHLFQPLLYQVATSGLSPAEIAYPIRSIFRNQKNVRVMLGAVTKIDLQNHLVKVENRTELEFDYLIVASGAHHNYFGHDEWSLFAPGLKSIDDATEIRRRILLAFEEAEVEADPERLRALLNFVIVGGGPTGVEMAGSIAELARFALKRDFRRINPRSAQVILVEGGDRILQSFPPSLSEKAQKSLERLGVHVRTKSFVSLINQDGVTVGSEKIPAATVIWAAGVQASSVGKFLQAKYDSSGRVIVNSDLSVPGHPEIYVAGDLAHFEDEKKQLVPGVAPAAMQQGRHAAHNILRQMKSEPTKPFHYVNKGNLATIGRASAVADINSIHLSGYPAWWTWLLVHIAYLIGFRNRIFVLMQWAWAYFTFQRGTRLITGGTDRFRRKHGGEDD